MFCDVCTAIIVLLYRFVPQLFHTVFSNKMATFKAEVQKHNLREDGTWNVKIRVTHHRDKAYIKTEYYVNKKQFTKGLDIKDPFVNDQLNATIAQYRKLVVGLGNDIELYNAKELAEYLTRKTALGTDSKIDFIKFSHGYLDKIRALGKKRTVNFPELRGSQYIVRAKGNSMCSTICDKDFVGIRAVKNKSNIEYGNPYGIITEDLAVFKRIRLGSSDDKVKPVSENPEYDPFEIEKNDIVHLFAVIGILSAKSITY